MLSSVQEVHLCSLFDEIGHPLPSEPFSVKLIKLLTKSLKKSLLIDEVFLAIDESEFNKTKYLNILMEKICE